MSEPRPLGIHLALIRQDRRLTLRDVEMATGKEVSNAYLSQIENGKIRKPSPNALLALSRVYEISYGKLMEMAGYAAPGDFPSRLTSSLAEHNLTEDEEAKLIEYLQFLRHLRPPVSE